MDALIIAAGFGSRLRDISDSKPMTPIAGIPLLELGVRQAKAAGAERVFPISGATGKGMDALLDAVLEYLPAATVTERPDGEQEEGEEQPWSPV